MSKQLKKELVFLIISLIPILIWIIIGLLHFYQVPIINTFESLLVGLGVIITAYIVTTTYNDSKFLSKDNKEKLSFCCFINFMVFFIYKEFRSESTDCLKILNGIVETFMVISTVYFSPILLSVFKKNREKLSNQKKDWMIAIDITHENKKI